MTARGKRLTAFLVVYLVINSVTIAWTRHGGGLALVWFGSGIAAAMLIGMPRRDWTRALVGLMMVSTLATCLYGFGPRLAAPLALFNAFEAWLVARLLLLARPQRDWLDTVGGLTALTVIGGIAAPGIAAIGGGFIASTAAPGPWHFHAENWWVGHGLGTLISFPLAYLATSVSLAEVRARFANGSALELLGHLLLIAVVSVAAIGQPVLPILFLPIVPLLLTAFRCGREGAALGNLVVATVVAWSFQHEPSLIANLPIPFPQKVLFLQFYVATLCLLAMPASVALRQRQLLLLELEEHKALERLIADHSDDALLNLDEHGAIRFASPAGARLSGEEALVGRPLAVFFDPLDEQLVRDALAQAARLPGETCSLERAVVRGEEQLWLEAKLRAVAQASAIGGRPEAIQGFAVTIRDVTARKQAELVAREDAETDPLTGLPNRRALLRRLEPSLQAAEQRPFALGIVDLDHFKAINDTYGHNAGDAALREVARTMRRMEGPGGYFARLGGEEFAFVAHHARFEDSIAACEALREAIASLRFAAPDGTEFHVSASVGLASITRRTLAAQALQAADALLYRAKDAGRNRVEATAQAHTPRVNRRAA